MCTVYMTASNMYRRYYHLFRRYHIHKHTYHCYISNGIHCSYFMKVYFRYRHAMNTALCRCDYLVHINDICFNFVRNIKMLNCLFDIMHVTMTVMMIIVAVLVIVVILTMALIIAVCVECAVMFFVVRIL